MNSIEADLPALSPRRPYRIATVVALLVAMMSPVFAEVTSSSAQTIVTPALSNLRLRYPSGSIQSQETAEQALSEAARERLEIETRYQQEQQACSPKFFATSCLDTAKEHRRFSLARVRSVEVDANAFKRRARVIERDQGLAERAAQVPAAPPKHVERQGKASAPVPPSDDVMPDVKAAAKPDESKKTAKDRTGGNRVADHDAKLKRLEVQQKTDEAKRDANVVAFEKRAREAEARQREIAANKARKEKERVEKLRQENESQGAKQ